MIPKSFSPELDKQNQVIEKIKEVYEFESELTDRMVMLSIFENFRTGGGLRLNKLGFDICTEFDLYEFTPVPLNKGDRNSLVYTSLDRICTSPYYIDSKYLYLSDELVLTQLTFSCDDFRKLFAAFM